MYTVYDWAEVRRLHQREHLSKKHIAERLGMSRTTVHRLLELPEPPRYERPRRPSLLDDHVESIKAMLKDDSAVPATVMLEHLCRAGYRGGISILKDLLSELRPLYGPAPDPFQRTTYIPGEICQLDWWDLPSRFVVPVGKGQARPAFGLGTGKTHLSMALGVAAARKGQRVAFASASEWVTRLSEAKGFGRLTDELSRLSRIPLLIVEVMEYPSKCPRFVGSSARPKAT